MSASPAPLPPPAGELAPDGAAAPVGREWAVDASGLDPSRLAGDPGVEALRALFEDLVEALSLNPVAAPVWHVFPGPHDGVTGILALSESHLACHTFPEAGGVTLNLYTCRERPAPDWERFIVARLAPEGREGDVRVRSRVFERTLPATGAVDADAGAVDASAG